MSHTIAAVCLLAALSLCVQAGAKSGPTLYPPERVENARRNIERFEWARQIRDNAVAAADVYAQQSDEFLWELVTPPDIPRGTQVNRDAGCPNCGKGIERFGTYPWKVNVFSRPWKIECPSCGEIFPKNDFARFYESGRDKDGTFRMELADRSLLYNSDHPDPADPLHTYGVDDGMGWKRSDGQVFRFIGYYGHYGTWAAVIAALGSFREAYIYTGNPLYARKAGLMLYRAASFYPEMDWSRWAKLGFSNSDGGSGMGKVYGRIWEMNIANTLMSCYDAVYPGLDDPQLLEYLSRKTGKTIGTSGLREIIERNVVQEAHDAILRLQIVGNEGMHQSTMTMAAVVIDTPGLTDKWLDWVFADGDLHKGDLNGGNIARLFDTKIDDDGMGNEASPLYNGLWRKTFRNMSEMLEHYPVYKGRKFTDFPKYRKMFENPVRLICLDKYIPHIGDCEKTGNPGVGGITVAELLYAYRTFDDPLFARMAYYLNGNNVQGIRGDIFDSEPEAIAKEIEETVRKYGPYVPGTDRLPAYGLAILRSGAGVHARALSIYYGRNCGHGHADTLYMELFGHGLNLMPDIGYPEHATVWAPRSEWTSNTISHNTVTVDRHKQRENIVGKANFVVSGKGASAAEIFADKPYPQTSLYQRTAALVDVSDKNFYVLDIFRVRGGSEHHYSLHGPEGEVHTQGLSLITQEKGTLAGEDIPLGADLGGRENRWADASGFQYLYDIRRDQTPEPYPSITWAVKDTWGVLEKDARISLKMHLLRPPGEVILAHGDPPQNKEGNPRRLTYIILPNSGQESTFASLIEPYTDKSTVKSIEREDDGDTVRVRVTLESGRIDHIVSSLECRKINVAGRDLEARFAILSQENGQITERLIVP